MQITGSNESSCEIHYHVTVLYTTASSRQAPTELQFASHSATQDITLLAYPNPVENLRVLQDEETFPISSCCCFHKGHINLSFSLDRNILSPGCTATIHLVGKNLSQVRVPQLQVTLLEQVKWTANDHSEQVTNTLLRETISTLTLPQWQPRLSRNHHTHEELLNQDEWNESLSLPLSIPARARNSYVGNLMEVSHHLVVTACTPFHVTTPCLENSLQVGLITDSPGSCKCNAALGLRNA